MFNQRRVIWIRADDVVKKDMEHIASALEKEFDVLSGRNLLITGGAGFLGYYLTQSILYWNERNTNKKPIRLWVYDNFARGAPKWISTLKKREEVNIVKHDIISALPNDSPAFSYIIHAASIASPFYYRLHPIETMDANVQGLRYLLDYALKQKRTKEPIDGLLFFSSSEVYGDPHQNNIPTLETYRGNVSCTGPRACYDESKRYGETLCVNFARHYGLPVKIARPFNNYGPGLRINDRRVIPDFARSIFANENIAMFSDGSPTRTFCYVADAIVGYYKILMNGRPAEAYNIGVEKPEVSVMELAERMANIGRGYFGYAGKIVRKISEDKDYLADSPSRRCPSISKAKEELGYSPSVSLDEGLLRTMQWYAKNLEEV